ncbi:MAG: DUF1700 domain-containing protein [Bacillota bacterium]
MTKHEFLTQLSQELNKNTIVDAAEILSEYEQHFAFKMADGFSEEEIAAKLGSPAALASQFESIINGPQYSGRKTITIIGLCFADFFTGMFFALLGAWGIIIAAFSLACATVTVCLLFGLNIHALIPSMPYLCAVIFGISTAALAVLTTVGFMYFAAFVRQLARAYGRFHHNAIAAASGGVVLPTLAIHPQLDAKANRRMRSTALLAFAVFAACFVLGVIAAMLSAGALEFWHAWGWFGYMGGY